MSTWHQQQAPVRLWHETKWTLVEDGLDHHACVERFASLAEAMEAKDRRGGYVLSPSSKGNASGTD
jgi:hypothetical protein